MLNLLRRWFGDREPPTEGIRQTREGFVIFSEDEPSMKAAKANALSSLDYFWSKVEAAEDDVGPYQVKAGLTTDNGGIEHIWMDVIAREGDKLRTRLANAPVQLPDLYDGAEILIDPERISDWGYWKNDQLYGAFTVRTMLPHMSPREQAQAREVLAPSPFEAG